MATWHTVHPVHNHNHNHNHNQGHYLSDSIFTELTRSNVFKVGIAYLVLAWVVVQVTQTAVPAPNMPEWMITVVFFLGIISFPFALFSAWALIDLQTNV